MVTILVDLLPSCLHVRKSAWQGQQVTTRTVFLHDMCHDILRQLPSSALCLGRRHQLSEIYVPPGDTFRNPTPQRR